MTVFFKHLIMQLLEYLNNHTPTKGVTHSTLIPGEKKVAGPLYWLKATALSPWSLPGWNFRLWPLGFSFLWHWEQFSLTLASCCISLDQVEGAWVAFARLGLGGAMGDSEWRSKRLVSQLAANDETLVCQSGLRWNGKSTSVLSQSHGLLAWSLIAIGRLLKEV